ncbi:MAG: hypothetical protein ACRDZY_01215 [Acidimicrobiales bacterium]
MLESLPPAATIEPDVDAAPPWPRVLLTGLTGARKSWEAALLSADDRLGGMAWLEVGATPTARQYLAIPDVRYQIIDHDGTWPGILGQLGAHWQLAIAAQKAGEPPIALTVDAMQGVFQALNSMADTRTRRKIAAQMEARHQDPDLAWQSLVDLKIPHDLHQMVADRHKKFLWFVRNWPGPATLICEEEQLPVYRANELTEAKDWALKGRRDLPGQCSAWVRLSLDGPPVVLKLHTVLQGVMAPAQVAEARTDFSLTRLVFDWVGCVAGQSRAPVSVDLDADQDAPGEVPAQRASPTVAPAVTARRAQAQAERLARENVRKGALVILAAPSLAEAQRLLGITEGSGLGDREVPTDVMTQHDRETLGVGPDTPLDLLALNRRVVDYCTRHGDGHRCDGQVNVGAHGPRTLPNPPPATATPEDPHPEPQPEADPQPEAEPQPEDVT